MSASFSNWTPALNDKAVVGPKSSFYLQTPPHMAGQYCLSEELWS